MRRARRAAAPSVPHRRSVTYCTTDIVARLRDAVTTARPARRAVVRLVVLAIAIPAVVAGAIGLLARSGASRDGGDISQPMAKQTSALGDQRARLRNLLAHVVTEMARRREKSDEQWFSAGVWRSGDRRCWPCNLGPGTAAAVLATRAPRGAARFRRLAIETFDTMLARHGRADGSFGPAAADQRGRGISTLNAALNLATAYIVLEPTLDRATADRWRAALVAATRYMAEQMTPAYYVNGNINLAIATLLRLTPQASGDTSFIRLFEQQWQFTLSPPQPRWRHFGLVVSRRPRRLDGADGRAYLAESGGGTPGFDADYLQLQSSYLTRLFVLTHLPESQRVLNLLTNQLLTRVRQGWVIDTSGGSRHPERGRKIPMLSPALPSLAFSGARPDLAEHVESHLGRVSAELRGALTYSYGPMYRAVGDLSLALLA